MSSTFGNYCYQMKRRVEESVQVMKRKADKFQSQKDSSQSELVIQMDLFRCVQNERSICTDPQ